MRRSMPSNQNTRCIDIREILKQEIKKSDGLGNSIDPTFNQTTSSDGTTSTPANKYGFEDTEIYFDSSQADTSSDLSTGEIKWDINLINNFSGIKNCIEISVGDIIMPKIMIDSVNTDFLYENKVFMEISNLTTQQSIIANNNNKYHFEFHVEPLTNYTVKLVPIKKTFFFQRPITSITNLNIKLYVPSTTRSFLFKPIPLPATVISIKSVPDDGTNKEYTWTINTPMNDAYIFDQLNQNTAIAYYISEYISPDTAANNYLTNPNGFYGLTATAKDQFYMTNEFASSIIPPTDAYMLIPKNRISFSVRFTSVVNQVTNYVHINQAQ